MYSGVSLDQAPPEDIPVRFFLSAPVFGILAGLLILFAGQDLFVSNWSVETIALTHLFTLGWLAMIMMGSFYQMVPVLVGGTVPLIGASRVVHAGFTLGVSLIVPGIYLLNETLIATASALLLISLLFFVVQISIALFKVKGDRPTVVAMRISIAAFLVTVLLGTYFSGGHASLWDLPDNRIGMTASHLVLGLFGWVGSLIMGVGFHVIPMFYMTPEFDKKKAYIILCLYGISLIALPAALLFESGTMFTLIAGAPGAFSLIAFSFMLFSLVGKRKRKISDTTLSAWKAALALLPLSLLAFIFIPIVEHEVVLFVFGILFILGFGLTVTTGMLYKILPFLIWFHRFSLLIGKVKVPLMRDISSDKLAARQLHVFHASLVILLAGIVGEVGIVIRFGGLAFACSSFMLLLNLLKMVGMKAPELPSTL
ncbi:MAG: hypothetical protein RQ824_02265 [bacterium]|nr:hypothetical protein [bacterium]